MDIKDIKTLYKPEKPPVDDELNMTVPQSAYDIQQEGEESASKKLEQRQEQRATGVAPRDIRINSEDQIVSLVNREPLTYEEAVAIEREKDRVLDEIGRTRDRIFQMRGKIDEHLTGDGTDLAFDVDLSKKPRLRRAIAKAFGIDKPTALTADMYLLALEARRSLEQEEVDGYVSGDWSGDEDE